MPGAASGVAKMIFSPVPVRAAVTITESGWRLLAHRMGPYTGQPAASLNAEAIPVTPMVRPPRTSSAAAEKYSVPAVSRYSSVKRVAHSEMVTGE